MCNGADEGWARVIEARGGRPRKSRGRAIAETPLTSRHIGGYLRDGNAHSSYRLVAADSAFQPFLPFEL